MAGIVLYYRKFVVDVASIQESDVTLVVVCWRLVEARADLTLIAV